MPRQSKGRSYDIIWERIRANPDKGVPVDILSPFTSRVIKAVKNVKYYDEVYRLMKNAEKKTGLMFVTKAIHPKDNSYVRVTFCLREFDTTLESDSYYLRKYPPGSDLVATLKLELMEPVTFGSASSFVSSLNS